MSTQAMSASAWDDFDAVTAPWIVMDLETGDAPAEAIAAKLADWKPPGNVSKAETIETKRDEARQRIAERAALLDAAPVLCVAIHGETERRLFNGMDNERHELNGWEVNNAGDEKQMLVNLRGWLDSSTNPSTMLVGHNLRGFDLPKLRSAYMRHQLRLPHCLALSLDPDEQSQPTADTMTLFARKFTIESNGAPFVSLDTVCQAFGVPRPKQFISGSEVPRLYRDGEHLAILTYCAIDAASTARVWQLMSGNSPDLR